MRLTILILTMLIWTITYGQLDKLKGTWVSNSNDVMVINDTINKYSNSNMLCTSERDEGRAFYLFGDTLSFQQRYYSSETNYKKLYVFRYDLLIIGKTDSSLTVRPISKLSMKFFNNRTDLKFIKQEYNKDKTIIFEKIIYHTTFCFGSCPTIDLEIDNDKYIYLSGKFHEGDSEYKIDSLKSGQFKGKLTERLYNELIAILQTTNLRTLEFPEKIGEDAPVTTLIIYFNGQRKYFKSMFPPTIADRLIKFLYVINQRTELTRTNEIRTLEK